MNQGGAIDLGMPQPAPEAPKGPFIRLLICLDCKSIEELPDFEGRAEDDHLLQILLERKHQGGSLGIAHRGHLMKVEIRHWSSPKIREEILRQIREGSRGLADIDITYYETKATFHEDAMKCFQKHLRPKGQCPDYGSAAKRLLPDTKALRKEAGLPETGGPKTFLCQFCPVHAYNMTKHREQTGAYE